MSNTLLNNVYPFFLDNTNKFGSAFYLYQVVSPKLNEDLTPLITLKKVGEKTRKNDPAYDNGFNDLDILTVLTEKSHKNSTLYLNEDIINRDKDARKKEVKLYNLGEKKFPAFELSNLTMKATIIGIRDNLRWQFYKFTPGKFIDIIISPNKFGLFEVMGNNEEIWLEQRGVYYTNDPGMINPLKYDHPSMSNQKFKGPNKNSEMNKAIRAREWRAFDSIQ